ncbi:glycosyltransferase [Collinsella tanakaei]|nr:glycosyltransferase [Collinsella tanakaei]
MIPSREPKQICLIGRIDPSGQLSDGQTVKTRTIWKLLKENYGNNAIVAVDTRDYMRNPFRVAIAFINAMMKCDDIVVLLSRGGRRAFFPFLSLAAKRFNKRIFHSLIGGKLADNIRDEDGVRLVRQLNTFQINWVESQSLVNELRRLGVMKVEYLPNFKDVVPLNADSLPVPARNPIRFCTFSRVCVAKGIPDAASATEMLNDEGIPCLLDVYGPVEKDFQTEFESILNNCHHVSYKGVIRSNDSVEVVKNYAALLFPTTWAGEGFPGSIIDAYAAGVPVIAYHWRYFEEIIEEGSTGIGCAPDVNALAEAMLNFVKLDDSDHMSIKRNCIAHAEMYSSARVFGQMKKTIDEASTDSSDA